MAKAKPKPKPKPRRAAPAAKNEPTVAAAAEQLRDQVTLTLIDGATAEAAEAFAVGRGLKPDTAAALVADCRRRITVAADYNRVEQVGLAVRRFNDLYGKAAKGGKDVRAAIAAQKELNKLLGLYAPAPLQAGADGPAGAAAADDDPDANRRRLELVAGYLLPLALAPADQYPIEEHARLAAEYVRAHRLRP